VNFWKAILGLVRRRFVGPPVLLLSLALGTLAYSLTPSHYSSTATMVLTTPTGGGTLSQDPNNPTGLSNPLLNFGEGLRTTSLIIIQAMNTPDYQARLGIHPGGTTTITIDDGRTAPNLLGTTGPFVYLESDSVSATEAHDVVVRARQMVQEELANRQKALGAPPSTFIVAVDVVPPSAPEALTGARVQAGALALLLSVVLGLGGTYLVLNVLTRLRRPGGRAAADGAAEQETEQAIPVVRQPSGLDSPTVQLPFVSRPAAPVQARGTNGVDVNTDVIVTRRPRRRRWEPPRTTRSTGTTGTTGSTGDPVRPAGLAGPSNPAGPSNRVDPAAGRSADPARDS
jgi:hypothetical protein